MAFLSSPRARGLFVVVGLAVVAGAVLLLRPERDKDALYNQETIAIMRRVLKPGSNGVDVGAFEGTLTKPMVKFAPQGTHYAFEPQPVYAKKLRERFPNVKVLECALGDADGTATFTLALDDPAYSGFKKQNYPNQAEHTQQIAVKVMKMDDAIPAGTPIAFIKIDVEGAEYSVLRGAKEIIRRDRPVIAFEYGKTGMKEFGTTPGMMWKLLHDELGLQLSLMRTWLDHGRPYTADEFKRMVEAGDEWMFVAYPADKS